MLPICEPLRIYRASKLGQHVKMVFVCFVSLFFLFFGVLLLLYSSRNFFEMCLALTFISASLFLVFSSTRTVFYGLPTELRVYSDRFEEIDPWGFPRANTIFAFVDVKNVFYNRDGCVIFNLFSSFWSRTLNSEVFQDAAEAQELCRYLTELLKTPTPAINTPVA